MPATKSHVHVVADTAARLAAVRTALECRHGVTAELLGAASIRHGEACALVVRVDLRIVENVAALKKTLGSLNHVRKRIFLLDQTVHLSIAQAYALGATLVLTGRVDQAKLLAA